MARISLSQRLARLESLVQPNAPATVARVISLVDRLEKATGEPLAVALHQNDCPAGTAGQPPLRPADTTNVVTVARWFNAVCRGHHALCPLCTPDQPKDSA